MTESNMKKWYVVRAVSGQENKVKGYIESEIVRLGMEDYLSQVLVPTEKVVSQRDGKKITKERIYFPGYVMIEANLTGALPQIIKASAGVIGFLGENRGGDRVPLRKAEVMRMLGKVDEVAVSVDEGLIPYEFGETVKVVDSTFNGFN